jgi:hypothetical protein
MSVLNLGLQGVALARKEMDDEEYEKEFKSCNGMSAVRKVAEKHEEVVEVALLAKGCAEADDALQTKKQQHEQEEDDDLLAMLHHDDDRELEEENILLQVEHQKDLVHHHRRRGRYEID